LRPALSTPIALDSPTIAFDATMGSAVRTFADNRAILLIRLQEASLLVGFTPRTRSAYEA
jgi:hypothetical protein